MKIFVVYRQVLRGPRFDRTDSRDMHPVRGHLPRLKLRSSSKLPGARYTASCNGRCEDTFQPHFVLIGYAGNSVVGVASNLITPQFVRLLPPVREMLSLIWSIAARFTAATRKVIEADRIAIDENSRMTGLSPHASWKTTMSAVINSHSRTRIFSTLKS